MPLEAHLEKRTLFSRVAESWLSKSGLAQRKRQMTPTSEPQGLPLSDKDFLIMGAPAATESSRRSMRRGRSLFMVLPVK